MLRSLGLLIIGLAFVIVALYIASGRSRDHYTGSGPPFGVGYMALFKDSFGGMNITPPPYFSHPNVQGGGCPLTSAFGDIDDVFEPPVKNTMVKRSFGDMPLKSWGNKGAPLSSEGYIDVVTQCKLDCLSLGQPLAERCQRSCGTYQDALGGEDADTPLLHCERNCGFRFGRDTGQYVECNQECMGTR